MHRCKQLAVAANAPKSIVPLRTDPLGWSSLHGEKSQSIEPNKAGSSETSPSLQRHELLVAALRTPVNRLVFCGQATQDDWADSS
jgi:hypothetical protein